MLGKLPTSALPCAANSRNPVDRSCLGVAAISWMIACGLFYGVAGGIGTAQAGADSGTVSDNPGRPRRRAQRGRRQLRGRSPRWPSPSRPPGRRPDRRLTRAAASVYPATASVPHRVPGPRNENNRDGSLVPNWPWPVRPAGPNPVRRGRLTPDERARGPAAAERRRWRRWRQRRWYRGDDPVADSAGTAERTDTGPGQRRRPPVARDRRAADGEPAAGHRASAGHRGATAPGRHPERKRSGSRDRSGARAPPRRRNRTRSGSGHRPASETPQKHPLRLGWAIPSTSGRPKRARSPHWRCRESSDCSP